MQLMLVTECYSGCTCSRTIRMPSHAGSLPSSRAITVCNHQYASNIRCLLLLLPIYPLYAFVTMVATISVSVVFPFRNKLCRPL